MKNLKFIVGGAALVGIVSVFLNWISVEGTLPKLLAGTLPESGMDNGGPIFLFLLALPLIAAAIGALKRFGRGLAVLSLIGSLCAAFMALVKFNDIEEAGAMAKTISASVKLSAAPGYYVFLVASSVALIVSLIALIKPEPKTLPPGKAIAT